MKLTQAIIGSVFTLSLLVFPALAQEQSMLFMQVPQNTLIVGQQGSEKQIARTITGDFEGSTCEVRAVATNNASAHPGSKFTITTGSESFSVSNVERDALVTTTATKDVTLGDDMIISVTLGADEEFSAGVDVTVTCRVEPPACEYDADIPADDPDCFEPCKYDEDIPADSNKCKKPAPVTPAEQPTPRNPQPDPTPAPITPTVAGKGSNDLPNTGPTSTTLMAALVGVTTYAITRYRQTTK